MGWLVGGGARCWAYRDLIGRSREGCFFSKMGMGLVLALIMRFSRLLLRHTVNVFSDSICLSLGVIFFGITSLLLFLPCVPYLAKGCVEW